MSDPTTTRPVAVVTGAARGIGLAIARWFLGRNHGVALIDIDAETLARTERDLDERERVRDRPRSLRPRERGLPRHVHEERRHEREHARRQKGEDSGAEGDRDVHAASVSARGDRSLDAARERG